MRISGFNSGACHPLCTLHDARCRAPCNTRYRLTGFVSAGRESNPLARVERFQIMFPSFLRSPFQDLAWRNAILFW